MLIRDICLFSPSDSRQSDGNLKSFSDDVMETKTPEQHHCSRLHYFECLVCDEVDFNLASVVTSSSGPASPWSLGTTWSGINKDPLYGTPEDNTRLPFLSPIRRPSCMGPCLVPKGTCLQSEQNNDGTM